MNKIVGLLSKKVKVNRMGSLPDVDLDIEGEKRDEVKRYVEQRFGGDNVASIGTYTTLQLKAAFGEMCRALNVKDAGTRAYLSEMLKDGKKWIDLFGTAIENSQFKNLVSEYGDLVNNIQLCLGTPKSKSVHACAMIIAPKYDIDDNPTTVFDYVPLRKTSDGMLVSEWEGGQMEAAGFLKEDVLGIKQLDKFAMIFNLIERSEDIDMYDLWNNQSIDLQDENVFEAFSKGYTADIFQFSGDGMTKMLKELRPDRLGDLIAANALYRPGPMEYIPSFIKRKHGEERVSYYTNTEHILKDTYGILCYQEQVMQICRDVAGFTLIDSDGIRKAIGKKIMSLMESYGKQFVEGAIRISNYSIEDAESLWDDIEEFGLYSFNRSHSACYAQTSYWCQWLKVNYPIQFWTASLTFADDKQIPPFIGEILDQGLINVMPPDINSSGESFTTNVDQKKIFWSLSKIAFAGETIVAKIIEDRNENGKYFDISEFIERTGANKRVINNLILSGSFDDMYNVNESTERLNILKEFNTLRWKGNSKVVQKDKEEFKETFCGDESKHEWFWYLQQRKSSGMAHLKSWHKVMSSKYTPNTLPLMKNLVSGFKFHSDEVVGRNVLVCGYIVSVEERKTKKGDLYARVLLDNNYVGIKITIWADTYLADGNREKVKDSKGKLMFFNGKVNAPDRFNDENTIYSVGSNFRGKGMNMTEIDVVG
jgi:DNA polymerase III subunit alpha